MAVAQPVTRADIEAKVAEIEGKLQEGTERAKPPLLAGGIALAILVIILAYVFGRRAGARKTTVVEVRRA